MIFAARQVLEKAIEHESDLYVLFVDLRKAYDSVPRTALWLVLEKLSVPPHASGDPVSSRGYDGVCSCG